MSARFSIKRAAGTNYRLSRSFELGDYREGVKKVAERKLLLK